MCPEVTDPREGRVMSLRIELDWCEVCQVPPSLLRLKDQSDSKGIVVTPAQGFKLLNLPPYAYTTLATSSIQKRIKLKLGHEPLSILRIGTPLSFDKVEKEEERSMANVEFTIGRQLSVTFFTWTREMGSKEVIQILKSIAPSISRVSSPPSAPGVGV